MKRKKVSTPETFKRDDSLLMEGDAVHALQRMPSNSVRCVVTSPPYWGLRDYGYDGQTGLEGTLLQFLNLLMAKC